MLIKSALFAILLLVSTGAMPDPAPTARAHGFSYAETVRNPGSKSAGSLGLLTFDGAPIIGFPGQVRTPIGSFFYVDSELLWEPQGWYPAQDIAIRTSAVAFSDADLQRGHYYGSQRAGTPPDWCYLPGPDAWYDPRRLTGAKP